MQTISGMAGFKCLCLLLLFGTAPALPEDDVQCDEDMPEEAQVMLLQTDLRMEGDLHAVGQAALLQRATGSEMKTSALDEPEPVGTPGDGGPERRPQSALLQHATGSEMMTSAVDEPQPVGTPGNGGPERRPQPETNDEALKTLMGVIPTGTVQEEESVDLSPPGVNETFILEKVREYEAGKLSLADLGAKGYDRYEGPIVFSYPDGVSSSENFCGASYRYTLLDGYHLQADICALIASQYYDDYCGNYFYTKATPHDHSSTGLCKCCTPDPLVYKSSAGNRIYEII